MTTPPGEALAESLRRAGDDPFASAQIPSVPPSMPVVTLYRDQLQHFRDRYAMLAEFAAVVCGVPIKDLCPLHMMMHLRSDVFVPRDDA